MAVLSKMKYRGFQFIDNPSTCKISYDKAIVKHKYPDAYGSELEDLGFDGAILTCTGVFSGKDAYKLWNLLQAEYKKTGPAFVFHPIYTDFKLGIMKNLTNEMENREDFVVYSFEIWSHDPVKVAAVQVATTPVSTSTYKPAVGAIVVCTGYPYTNSTDVGTKGTYLNGVTMTVTSTNYGTASAKYPVHVGSTGWMSLDNIKKK